MQATTSRADLAQLGERKIEDLDVAGSVPAYRRGEALGASVHKDSEYKCIRD